MDTPRRVSRRTARPVAAFGAALALVAGLSAEARAANGTLSYRDSNGIDHAKDNPTDGVCYSFTSEAGSVADFTDTDGRLFTGSLCEESTFLINIHAGSSLVFGGTKPRSARLGG
ncbi:hypothetical protein AB0C81_09315 [Streptomyces roseoverticillatus]|uniref:hypothetical protein n=1 Tax=Streptomyces roseoverticillatus TaxID=66429 RepID=UPI003402A30F